MLILFVKVCFKHINYCKIVHFEVCDQGETNDHQITRITHFRIPVHQLLYSVYSAPDTESVDCEHGEVRLVNGPNIRQGRVEVCINNAFGSICSVSFVDADAAVVCVSAGFFGEGKILVMQEASGVWHYFCSKSSSRLDLG